MRILHNSDFKRDKRFILAFIITLICSVICGIVLYKPAITNIYFMNFADDYVFKVFNFKNGSLLFPHIISDLIYLYLVFLIAYVIGYKYVILAILFLRGIFFGLYVALLFGAGSFGGVTVAVFVFIPATLVSIALLYFVAEFCKAINGKYAVFMPLVLAVLDCVLYAFLINALFRVVIAIV